MLVVSPFLNANDSEPIFICSLDIHISSLVKGLLEYFAYF